MHSSWMLLQAALNTTGSDHERLMIIGEIFVYRKFMKCNVSSQHICSSHPYEHLIAAVAKKEFLAQSFFAAPPLALRKIPTLRWELLTFAIEGACFAERTTKKQTCWRSKFLLTSWHILGVDFQKLTSSNLRIKRARSPPRANSNQIQRERFKIYTQICTIIILISSRILFLLSSSSITGCKMFRCCRRRLHSSRMNCLVPIVT